MTSYITVDLRRLVASRARFLCEYCLLHEDDTYLGCQVDHIIAEKHGGATDADNLGYACALCNRAKGTDIGSIALSTGEFCRFFNPRSDHWGEHFSLAGTIIVPESEVGEVTARLLGFNETDRILEREAIQLIGRYPHESARELVVKRIH
jgi:hypothetical protein